MINIQGALTGGGCEKITLNRTAMPKREYHQLLRHRWYALLLNAGTQIAYVVIGSNMLDGDAQLSPVKIAFVILIVDVAVAINMMGSESTLRYVGPSVIVVCFARVVATICAVYDAWDLVEPLVLGLISTPVYPVVTSFEPHLPRCNLFSTPL